MNFLDIIFFCTLIVIYGIAVILLSGGNTFMRKMFLSEVQTELDKCNVTNEVFTEEEISNLPEPVQRYFRYCGYIGKEKMTNARFVWDDYLREHQDAAVEYGNLKAKLAERFPNDIEAYMNGKNPFIKELEQKEIKWYRGNSK
jgi:hypothetical protein